MIINHNIAALNTSRALNTASGAQSKSMEKLSSGLRINRAGDDAAGLAISEKMRGQIRGLDQASRNAQDGISLIQTSEGALNETHDILQRMRELSVQSANDTNTASDRSELQKEVDQLSQEVSRIGNNTEFNTQKLLDGSFKGTFQIGANQDQNLALTIGDTRGFTLGVAGAAKVDETKTGANTAKLADGTYSVVKNGAAFDLLDKEGTKVGTSADGLTFTDLAATPANVATFTNALADGDKIKVADTTVTGTRSIANTGLQAGSYTYDATAKALKDGNGNVVAASTDGISFTDPKDSTKEWANFTAALTDKQTVTVGGIDISTQKAANSAITTINSAIETVSGERSKLGAYQNRLEHTINNLGTSSENLTAAESRVRDVDMAAEMVKQTKSSILSQAAQAMLAQANQQPQAVLQLLR
ncbi:A-type flagellin [compost metagenome]